MDRRGRKRVARSAERRNFGREMTDTKGNSAAPLCTTVDLGLIMTCRLPIDERKGRIPSLETREEDASPTLF